MNKSENVAIVYIYCRHNADLTYAYVGKPTVSRLSPVTTGLYEGTSFEEFKNYIESCIGPVSKDLEFTELLNNDDYKYVIIATFKILVGDK